RKCRARARPNPIVFPDGGHHRTQWLTWEGPLGFQLIDANNFVVPANAKCVGPSLGPMTELAGLMRNSGCTGAFFSSFAASAWKLFHSATILDGMHGARSLTRSLAIVAPLRIGRSNKSPTYSTMLSASSAPKPARLSAHRKRTQRVIV